MSKKAVRKNSCNVANKQKTWEQMSKKERKIAVAEDVIANIYAKRLNVRTGAYIQPNDTDASYDFDALLNFGMKNEEICDKLKEKCRVCAKGSLFLCKVSKFNGFDLSGEDINDWSNETTIDGLSDAFDEDELNEIEAAFESDPNHLSDSSEYEDCEYDENGDDIGQERFEKDFGHWRRNFPEPEDRLLGICQNIVDNGGTFKYKQEYTLK